MSNYLKGFDIFIEVNGFAIIFEILSICVVEFICLNALYDFEVTVLIVNDFQILQAVVLYLLMLCLTFYLLKYFSIIPIFYQLSYSKS